MSHQMQLGEDGKDTVIFASRRDHASKSKIELPILEPAPGVILPNGEINWLCPCLGGLATGPCGIPFRQAFTCFHLSSTDPKGSDCVDAFKEMQDCMVRHPKIYKAENIPKSALTEAEERAAATACKAQKEVQVPKL